MDKQLFETNYRLISRIFQQEIALEILNKSDNIKLFGGSGIGKFFETLALYFNDGYKSVCSGGSGYDLINLHTKTVVEVKSCCTIQSVHCKHCKTKYNTYVYDRCPNCGQKDFVDPKDSRFGIDSKSLLNQYDEKILDNLTMAHIALIDQNEDSLSIQTDWYKIKFDDELTDIRIQYFKNQYYGSDKSNTCNLLPLSYNFYKLCPLKLCTIKTVLPFDVSKDVELSFDYTVHNDLRVPMAICNESEKPLFKSLKSYDDLTQTVSMKEFTQMMPYRKANLNKERGSKKLAENQYSNFLKQSNINSEEIIKEGL